MRLGEFCAKALFVTFCVGMLLYLFLPRYHFFENGRCGDMVTGEVRSYGSRWR